MLTYETKIHPDNSVEMIIHTGEPQPSRMVFIDPTEAAEVIREVEAGIRPLKSIVEEIEAVNGRGRHAHFNKDRSYKQLFKNPRKDKKDDDFAV